MPNHIINQITAPPHILAALGEPVDFARIVPWPAGFHWPEESIGVGFASGVAQGLYETFKAPPREPFGRDFKRLDAALFMVKPLSEWSDDNFDELILGLRNARACGHADLLDLQSEIWGTKWNAYDFEKVSDTCIRFQTAWRAPFPVMHALSTAHPDVDILHDYADEDIGSNCGAITWRSGACSLRPLADTMRQFALTLWRREDEDEGDDKGDDAWPEVGA
jgi:hypothetical protein